MNPPTKTNLKFLQQTLSDFMFVMQKTVGFLGYRLALIILLTQECKWC